MKERSGRPVSSVSLRWWRPKKGPGREINRRIENRKMTCIIAIAVLEKARVGSEGDEGEEIDSLTC